MPITDYYVYLHRRVDNSSVFYVGKGRDKRCQATDRNEAWKKIVSQTDYTIEKIEVDMDNSTAHARELFWIDYYSKNNELANIRRANMGIKKISDDVCNRYFIDPDSPSGLSKKLKNGNKKQVGSLQFRYKSKQPAGWFVNVSTGNKIAVHRIIMQLLGNTLSSESIVNHINCNPCDNRIENLEVCSQQENNKRKSGTLNICLPSNNSSGFVGIMEVTNINKGFSYKYAMATWSDNGKSKSKKFSYNKYGKELAWQLASQHRKLMVELFYKDSK
jgi:hypothetical protein